MQRLTFELEFVMADRSGQEPGAYRGLIADIEPGLGDLRAYLQEAVSGDAMLRSVEIVDVDLTEGSLLFTIVANVHDAANWLVWFGSLVAGVEYLRQRLISAIRRFFRSRNLPGLVLVVGGSRWEGIPPTLPPRSTRGFARHPESTREVDYLIASNAALIALLAAIALILVLRG